MVSSGVMWSQPVKERLLDHLPQVLIFDSLGSSEAVGMAASLSSKGTVTGTARFALGAGAVVITDDGRTVAPGSGEIGQVGVSGLLPVGYYKDESRPRPPSRSSTACATRCRATGPPWRPTAP